MSNRVQVQEVSVKSNGSTTFVTVAAVTGRITKEAAVLLVSGKPWATGADVDAKPAGKLGRDCVDYWVSA